MSQINALECGTRSESWISTARVFPYVKCLLTYFMRDQKGAKLKILFIHIKVPEEVGGEVNCARKMPKLII